MEPFAYLAKSRIVPRLLSFVAAADDWVKYHEFDTLIVPHDILAAEPFFARLPPFVGGILRMAPNTCYTWHVDGKRKGTVNMLLHHNESHCLFALQEGVYFPTVELPYEMGHYYAFNTQVPHTVFNMGGYRYLFSIEFARPLEYDQLVTIALSGQESGAPPEPPQ